jgi:myo-inositol-1-phosphate synthase
MDRGIGGPIIGPSAYFMKSPPVQFTDEEARQMVEEFTAGETPLEVVDRPEHQPVTG